MFLPKPRILPKKETTGLCAITASKIPSDILNSDLLWELEESYIFILQTVI